MSDYRLPMDADGVKYHGTVDQNEENPGHFMYGLDENGNKRIIRTDEQGNVLTKVTGSNMEYLTYRGINIPSESRVVIDTINVIGYKQYSVGVVTNVQHNYSVDKTPYVGGNVLDSRGRIFMESDYNAVSERQDVLTTDVRIRITNNDNVALRISYFYIFLYK